MSVETLAEQPPTINFDEIEPEIIQLGFMNGRELFDRQRIELEATELLDNRSYIRQPEIKRPEREDNARTALMEALTSSGHLSRVELTGTLEEIYDQMIGRLLNGWGDNLPEHEKKRRFAELTNVLFNRRVHQSIVAGELPESTAIWETSDYPEPLVGTNIGYRHKNKKGMGRSTHLVNHGDGQYAVVIEQISRSNGTWQSTSRFLGACGIRRESEDETTDLTALNTPLLYSTRDYVDGAVDVIKLLDYHSGQDVLYGDKGIAKEKHVPYEELRPESARRESEIECYVGELADLEEQLDNWVSANLISYQEKTETFRGEVRRILQAICRLDPEYAEATFGQRAAPAYHEAAILEARGEHDKANALLAKNGRLEEPVTFCGVTISAEYAKQMGLKVNSIDSLMEKGKKNWKWKKGVCQVKTCPTRPGRTEVGPCSVCRGCQHKFDKGIDPTKSILPVITRKRGEHQ